MTKYIDLLARLFFIALFMLVFIIAIALSSAANKGTFVTATAHAEATQTGTPASTVVK